jgi:hypothetical protein
MNQAKPNQEEELHSPSQFSVVFNLLIHSKSPGIIFLKYILVALVIVAALSSFIRIIEVFESPFVYRKDFLQEYLLAKSVLEGADPYLPIPLLAEKFIGDISLSLLPNPTPHPPPVAVLFLPFALLDYITSSILWLMIELGCMVWVAYRISIWTGTVRIKISTIILVCLFLSWRPFFEDLGLGQLMIPILAILVETWLALQQGKPVRAGSYLGLAISLKLIAWPILLYLLFKKQWKASIAAISVVTLTHLAAAMTMGTANIWYYYLNSGDWVYPLYRAHNQNFSSWSIGWRIFEGTGSPVLVSAVSPPLINAPELAHYVSVAIPLGVLAISLLLAIKVHGDSQAFGIMVGASILISPIAWIHYFTLATIPIAIAMRGFYNGHIKPPYMIIIAALLLFPSTTYLKFIAYFAQYPFVEGQDLILPSGTALFSVLPTVIILCLSFLLYFMKRNQTSSDNELIKVNS